VFAKVAGLAEVFLYIGGCVLPEEETASAETRRRMRSSGWARWSFEMCAEGGEVKFESSTSSIG